MVPEIIDGGAVSVMEVEPLRPPESWPGAGGLKSVAPQMPSWPTGPIPGSKPPEGAITARPKKKGTGEGWPGTEGVAGAAQPCAAPPKAQPPPEAVKAGADSAGIGPHAMRASLFLLLACLGLAAWVILDADSRVLQAAVLVVVLIAGGVFVRRTLRGGAGPRNRAT